MENEDIKLPRISKPITIENDGNDTWRLIENAKIAKYKVDQMSRLRKSDQVNQAYSYDSNLKVRNNNQIFKTPWNDAKWLLPTNSF